MSNPLFQQMGGMMQAMNPMAMVMQRFNQFKQTFRGDPRQQVQQLLNSGRITQAQYDAAVQQANQLMQMMGGK